METTMPGPKRLLLAVALTNLLIGVSMSGPMPSAGTAQQAPLWAGLERGVHDIGFRRVWTLEADTSRFDRLMAASTAACWDPPMASERFLGIGEADHVRSHAAVARSVFAFLDATLRGPEPFNGQAVAEQDRRAGVDARFRPAAERQ
jgi:hypothetical protein